MCIVCNCDDGASMPGSDFLVSFALARDRMQDAAQSMLECSRVAASPEQRKRYDRAYKRMRRIIRDWNRIEQQREFRGEKG